VHPPERQILRQCDVAGGIVIDRPQIAAHGFKAVLRPGWELDDLPDVLAPVR
jgi:hypothetical protein